MEHTFTRNFSKKWLTITSRYPEFFAELTCQLSVHVPRENYIHCLISMIEVTSLTKNLLSYLLFGQELPEPFRTMLEVMVQFMKNRDVQSGSTSVGADKSSQKSKQTRYQ